MSDDPINHPSHYTSHPSGVECVVITEHMMFNVGCAIKYLWRAGLKDADAVRDLKKAAWYVAREITRLENGQKDKPEEPGASTPTADDGAGEAKRFSAFGYLKGSRG